MLDINSRGRLHSKAWLPGFRVFGRSFLRGTLSSSDQASVPSDALVKPRLDFLLMSRRRALVSGLFGCYVFRFRWNPIRSSLRIQEANGAPANEPAGLGRQRRERYRPSLSLQCQVSFASTKIWNLYIHVYQLQYTVIHSIHIVQIFTYHSYRDTYILCIYIHIQR